MISHRNFGELSLSSNIIMSNILYCCMINVIHSSNNEHHMHCDGATCCDCEVMDFDGEDKNFMMGQSNLNVCEHRFINTSTIETTKRGHRKGHNRKYMEMEGLCHDLLDHFSK